MTAANGGVPVAAAKLRPVTLPPTAPFGRPMGTGRARKFGEGHRRKLEDNCPKVIEIFSRTNNEAYQSYGDMSNGPSYRKILWVQSDVHLQ